MFEIAAYTYLVCMFGQSFTEEGSLAEAVVDTVGTIGFLVAAGYVINFLGKLIG